MIDSEPLGVINRYWLYPIRKRMKPRTGKTYSCLIRHWHSNNIKEVLLVKVKEDDVDWRTADDRSELSYDWTVVGFRKETD